MRPASAAAAGPDLAYEITMWQTMSELLLLVKDKQDLKAHPWGKDPASSLIMFTVPAGSHSPCVLAESICLRNRASQPGRILIENGSMRMSGDHDRSESIFVRNVASACLPDRVAIIDGDEAVPKVWTAWIDRELTGRCRKRRHLTRGVYHRMFAVGSVIIGYDPPGEQIRRREQR